MTNLLTENRLIIEGGGIIRWGGGTEKTQKLIKIGLLEFDLAILELIDNSTVRNCCPSEDPRDTLPVRGCKKIAGSFGESGGW